MILQTEGENQVRNVDVNVSDVKLNGFFFKFQAQELIANIEDSETADENPDEPQPWTSRQENEGEESTPTDANFSRSAKILKELEKLRDDVIAYDQNQTNHYKVIIHIIQSIAIGKNSCSHYLQNNINYITDVVASD